MAQEQFAGPEYFTEFDPERFAKQFAEKIAAEKATVDETKTGPDTADSVINTTEKPEEE